MTMSNEKYSGTAQLLHWLIAVLIVAQFTLVWTADALPRGDTRTMLMLTHTSVGFTVLVLAVLRLAWRFMHRPPAFPATMSVAEQWLARTTHWGLYLLIFLMPLSGWLLWMTAGRDINWFWLISIPGPLGKDRELHELFETAHEFMSWLL